MSSTQVHSNGNKPAKAKSNGDLQTPPVEAAKDGGKLIVVTAPLTETIDHAGYFIQMGMASMPVWMQWVLDKKYPNWSKVQYNDDGTASYMPAGVRLVEKSLEREFRASDIAACYP